MKLVPIIILSETRIWWNFTIYFNKI